MARESDVLFGRIAFDRGFISKAQLGAAMREQQQAAAAGNKKSLAEILKQKQFLDQRQFQRVLRAHRMSTIRAQDAVYGETAVKKGYVPDSAVKAALDHQLSEFQSGKLTRLCQILLSRKALTQQQHEALQRALRQWKGQLKLEEPTISQFCTNCLQDTALPVAEAGRKLPCSSCGTLLPVPGGKKVTEKARQQQEAEELDLLVPPSVQADAGHIPPQIVYERDDGNQAMLDRMRERQQFQQMSKTITTVGILAALLIVIPVIILLARNFLGDEEDSSNGATVAGTPEAPPPRGNAGNGDDYPDQPDPGPPDEWTPPPEEPGPVVPEPGETWPPDDRPSTPEPLPYDEGLDPVLEELAKVIRTCTPEADPTDPAFVSALVDRGGYGSYSAINQAVRMISRDAHAVEKAVGGEKASLQVRLFLEALAELLRGHPRFREALVHYDDEGAWNSEDLIRAARDISEENIGRVQLLWSMTIREERQGMYLARALWRSEDPDQTRGMEFLWVTLTPLPAPDPPREVLIRVRNRVQEKLAGGGGARPIYILEEDQLWPFLQHLLDVSYPASKFGRGAEARAEQEAVRSDPAWEKDWWAAFETGEMGIEEWVAYAMRRIESGAPSDPVAFLREAQQRFDDPRLELVAAFALVSRAYNEWRAGVQSYLETKRFMSIDQAIDHAGDRSWERRAKELERNVLDPIVSARITGSDGARKRLERYLREQREDELAKALKDACGLFTLDHKKASSKGRRVGKVLRRLGERDCEYPEIRRFLQMLLDEMVFECPTCKGYAWRAFVCRPCAGKGYKTLLTRYGYEKIPCGSCHGEPRQFHPCDNCGETGGAKLE